ncbi:hypothetical protein DPEC_G00167140 [Dallia pectoralis]|uniref:Uncharacterized protein n=1 Tax=Dallia pectoralis TaxID=75939 RepID=A0ACC2GIC4_DALPE|nr:hypothetical protein DPEC_G00167140 [Dallia pectoralis]
MAQSADVAINRVLDLKKTHTFLKHKDKLTESEAVRQLLREWPHLKIDEEGILRRETTARKQLVVPEALKPVVYQYLHGEMGHLGADRMVALARERFFWPKMRQEIEHYVTQVCRCMKRKIPNRPIRTPIQSIETSAPFELISIDYAHLDKCQGGEEYILVVVDHFTKYAQTAARKLFDDFNMRFVVHPRYITIRERSLRILSFTSCKTTAVFATHARPHTTHKLTRQSASTETGQVELGNPDVSTPMANCVSRPFNS